MSARTINVLRWAVAISILACACAKTPTADQIKADLIGRQIGDQMFGPFYRFESLSEFEDFDVERSNEAGDILEYSVKTVLKGSHGRCYATLGIAYRKEGGKWQLVNVTDSKTLKCPKG